MQLPQTVFCQARFSVIFRGRLKVQIAGFHMKCKALSWIRGLRRNKLLSTWEKFVDDMCERFGRAEYENKLEELSRL